MLNIYLGAIIGFSCGFVFGIAITASCMSKNVDTFVLLDHTEAKRLCKVSSMPIQSIDAGNWMYIMSGPEYPTFESEYEPHRLAVHLLAPYQREYIRDIGFSHLLD